eukprot:18431-Heterococcus_DN1.PRE.1
MSDLTRLWHKGVVPNELLQNTTAVATTQGNDASSQAQATAQATATAVIAASPYTTSQYIQHYNDVLLTGDVTSRDFRSTLPLSLDAFCSHLERCANETRESMHEYWLADAASVVIEYLLPMITALLQYEATAEQIANSKGITSSHDHHTAYSATARNGGISNNNKHAVSTLSLTSSNGMMMRKLPAALSDALRGSGSDSNNNNATGISNEVALDEYDEWFDEDIVNGASANSNNNNGNNNGNNNVLQSDGDGVGGMLSSNSVHSGIHNSDIHEHTTDSIQSLTSQYNNTNDTKKKHVSTGITGKSSATHANLLAAKHIISILDTVSMLMSRQIRGTVERSLSGLVDFFGRANHSDHSGDSAFILHLRINEEAFELLSSDEHDSSSSDSDSGSDNSDNDDAIETETDGDADGAEKRSKKGRKSSAAAASAAATPQKPTASVMIIEPSLSDLQLHACSCVDKIVSSVQKFPRVDTLLKSQLLSTTVPRTSVLHSAISVSATKPLGPCTVVSTDSIVSDAKVAIKQSLAQHLVLPTGLIQSFQPFTPLLDGQEADYVND